MARNQSEDENSETKALRCKVCGSDEWLYVQPAFKYYDTTFEDGVLKINTFSVDTEENTNEDAQIECQGCERVQDIPMSVGYEWV